MKRDPRLVVSGVLIGALVALLAFRQHDEARLAKSDPAARLATTEQRHAAPARIVYPHSLEHTAAASPPADIAEFMDFSGEPKSGATRLKVLRLAFGQTNGELTLTKMQLEFLSSLASPTPEQRRALEQALRNVQELDAKARAQLDEIEHFDVNAPPEADPSHARAGPPVAVSTALGLKHEEWSALVAEHYGPSVTVSRAAFGRIQRYLAEMQATLTQLEIPSELAERARERFLPIVDILIREDPHADPGETDRILATRAKEFVVQVRSLGAVAER